MSSPHDGLFSTDYLGESDLAQNGQKNVYTRAKAVLNRMGQRGWIVRGIFPKNPYPHSNRNTGGEKALSQPEFAQVTHAIKTELQRLASKEGRFSTYDLGICVLAIAARTGLNPTPILELPVGCLREHPLKADRRLLISYKRRGNNTHIQSLRRSEDVELFATVMPDVTRIIDAVTRTNAADREASDYPHLLFVYESQAKRHAGAKRALSYINLQDAIRAWVTHHGLTDDDGGRLRLSVMRLRKTFENRIMELSGGDAFVAAAMNGHSPSVAAEHYHEPPKDAVANFRFLGEVLVQSLREHDEEGAASAGVNTPVAACKDPINGHRAPKDGSYCMNFLQCFRCRSFLVTGDDLYRLYSFYWLVIRERDRIGAKKWKRYYGHIVRTIDNNIAPQFDPDAIQKARLRAWREPHPYWRDPGMLEGMTDG